MSVRDILITLLIFGSLPFCLARPWIGILVWSWIGYMSPHRLTWGFAYNMPFAQIVALTTIAGFCFTKDRRPLPSAREVLFLIALWALFFISTHYALYPADSWDDFVKVSKILFMVFLTLLLFQDFRKLKMLAWVIALAIGFYGLKGGIFTILTGAQHMVLGPADSFISANTEMGLALNMILPLLIFLRREETRPKVKIFLTVLFLLCAISVLATYSRGAFLGLGVVIVSLFLKGRFKVIAVFALIVGVYTASTFLPENWYARMGTIQTYEEDTSAMERITAWKLSVEMARHSPLYGMGFQSYRPDTYEKYLPEADNKRVDAHSIFFQVLGEHGFTGLALFAGLIGSTFLTLRRIKRRSAEAPELRGVYNFADMLEVSLLAYLVCGAFLAVAYFDLFYHLIAITVILKRLAFNPPAREPAAEPHSAMSWRHETGKSRLLPW